jgi:hypothetical protein
MFEAALAQAVDGSLDEPDSQREADNGRRLRASAQPAAQPEEGGEQQTEAGSGVEDQRPDQLAMAQVMSRALSIGRGERGLDGIEQQPVRRQVATAREQTTTEESAHGPGALQTNTQHAATTTHDSRLRGDPNEGGGDLTRGLARLLVVVSH